MIHDHLNNSQKYEPLHLRFKQAFDFLHSADLQNLPEGKILIDGENIFATVALSNLRQADESKIECHRQYIDIQVPASTTETMGWCSIEDLKTIAQKYDDEKDIMFFEDKATSFATVQPNEFVIFFPEDGHQPCIGVGKVKKIIIKIKL